MRWGAHRIPVTSTGRDHHVAGFSVWRAVHFGATNELGVDAVENVVSMYNLHITILHLLGLDHGRLKYRYGGRDMSLSDLHSHVVHEILR